LQIFSIVVEHEEGRIIPSSKGDAFLNIYREGDVGMNDCMVYGMALIFFQRFFSTTKSTKDTKIIRAKNY
jgi:hypothetical protein